MVTYPAGISADGTYFIDQNNQPIPFFCDDCWQLIVNGGRWSSGNWQAEIDTYLTRRAAQGYTAVLVETFSYSSVWPPVYTDMRLWDGTWPFTSTNNPASGMNNTFWARFDYLITHAQAAGMAVVIDVTTPNGESPRAVWGNNTTTWAAYGTALGNRYKTGFPNLFYLLGDDYFGDLDAGWDAMRAAIRATGDTHPYALMGYQETTARTDIHSGAANTASAAWSQFDWVYTYNVSYPGVIMACGETPRVPVIYADGANYLSTGWEGDGFVRKMLWRALASGACGCSTGDYAISGWDGAASPGYVTASFYSGVMTYLTAAFKALPGWWKLRPDTTSQLVTAGRGTALPPITSGGGGTQYSGNTDNYVCAAYAADRSLAVIYGPLAFSITIDQSKMAAGYTATWLDPTTGVTTAATPGATYSSGPRGTHALDGQADWVLILQGPATTTSGPAYGGSVAVTGGGDGTWTSPASAAGAPDATYATWTVT